MFRIQRFLGLVLALLTIAALGASAAVCLAQAADRGYRMGPKDLVSISVLEAPDMSGEARINENGEIKIPIVGEVKIGGMTSSEAERVLQKLLEERYLQQGRANVTIRVKEYRSKPINVIGAVRTPGPLDLSGRWTLLEAITAAGGLATDHGPVAYVMRRAENGLSHQIELLVEDLLYGGDTRLNIPILAGDLINIPETVEVTISCLGEVQNPSVLEFRSNERLTLLSAIARAGGLTERASRKILIKRDHRSGDVEEIEVDYKQIVSGKSPDVRLKNGDVVIVKQSFF